MNALLLTAILPLVVVVASALLTAQIRRYALEKNMLDVPNGRSSHSVATPRGGGLAIVIVYLLSLAALWVFGLLNAQTILALGLAGGLVAIVGFVDDKRALSAGVRLVCHFIAAAIALIFIENIEVIRLFDADVSIGLFAYPLFAIALVWMLNLYNFMDGINGLAGLQAVTFGLGAAIVCHFAGEGGLMLASLFLASASLGFLYWNFPKGQIFMGDVGSGFLGIVIGIIILMADPASNLFWALVILMAVFVTDATFTLLKRMARREKLSEAHRGHAYQIASRHLQSHVKVSGAIALFNIAYLLPLALLVVAGWLMPEIGLVLGYGACLAISFFIQHRLKEPVA